MSDIAKRVVARFTEKHAAELTKKFLNAIERVVSRYGSAKREEIFEVLRFFGYDVDPTVSILDLGMRAADLPAKAGAAHYEKLKQLVVTALPESPTVGAIYIMDLHEAERSLYAEATVKYHAWEGVESWTIRSPEGKTFELLPDQYARSKKRDRIDGKPLLEWVRKNTDLAEKFKELQNVKKVVYIQTRDNTGTCGACLRNIKLKEKSGSEQPVIVLHGYRRPGDGYGVIGRCYGVDFPPYELSDAASKHVLHNILPPRLKSQKEYLLVLQRNDPAELTELPGRSFFAPPIKREKVTADEWAGHLKRCVGETEGGIEETKRMIKLFEGLVRDWKLAPLPTGGQDMPLADRIVF